MIRLAILIVAAMLLSAPTSRADSLTGADLVAVGAAIFADANLSEPAGTSCASCHVRAQGFAGNHGATNGVAQGALPTLFAKRNTPSLRYLKFIQPFHFHWGEDVPLPDAYGGLFWDGRADTIALAVQQPLLNPLEMANVDGAHVAAKVLSSGYGAAFLALFPAASSDAVQAMNGIGSALEAFLTTDEMAPFSSRYDDYLRGKVTLSAPEQHGLALFIDPVRGGCNACHALNSTSPDPTRSLFTDYGYESPGIPRNTKVAANNDAARFDLGLCDRTDNPLAADTRLCGQFRTPSLRNVAKRQYFMHNGYFTSLKDVVTFYATRSVDPGHYYPVAGQFSDVPAVYQDQVDQQSVPYNLQPGQPQLLNDADINDLVTFLATLTDADLL